MDAVRDFEFCTNILQPMLLVFLGFLCICRTSHLYGLLETIVGHEWDKLFELWTELRRAILFFFPHLIRVYNKETTQRTSVCVRGIIVKSWLLIVHFLQMFKKKSK